MELEINSFISEKVKEYNDFILSKDCNKKPSDEELKVYIITNKLLPHKCKTCNMEPVWNKKPIDFLLDRRNNDILDNNIENLRFLCPNCYSQIKKNKTIFTTSVKANGLFCSICNKRIKYKTNTYKGIKCYDEVCKTCKTQEKLKNMYNKATGFKEL